MRKHLIIAGLVLAFEAYVGVGLIGMGYGMVLVVVFTILTIAQRQRRSERFRIAVIYTLMFVATMALLLSNIRLAQHRADPVISAVNRYHSEHGHYPKTLDELVPAYLPSVPRAGFTLLSRDFRYYPFHNDERPQLCFAAMFHGLFAYDFYTGSWRTNE
jgi:hypothetical protein